MSYSAIITPISVRTHPTADKLQIGTCSNSQVIVDLSTIEGELGIFFPCDGKLSREFLLANQLYRKHPDTGEPIKGFFETNGRVRTQKFRGVESEGFWCPLSYLEWTGADLSKLKSGDMITSLNNKLICEKYYPPATYNIIHNKQRGQQKKKIDYSKVFKEHWDTQQLKYYINKIPTGSLIYITDKIHGSSGRTGLVSIEKPLNFIQKLWNKFIPSLKFQTHEWKKVTGTRRTVLDTNTKVDTGFYKNTNFRRDIHEKITPHKGEVIYYEIAGYTDKGNLIMPAHTVKDKDLRKQYGDKMVYKYGCSPEANPYRVFVYRITQVNEDGQVTELSWPQVKRRVGELGLETVPELTIPILLDNRIEDFDSTKIINITHEEVLNIAKSLAEGPDPVDPSHIKEGIVIRVEHETGTTTYKLKGYHFMDMEGILKDNDRFIDPEEVS